MDFLQAIIKVNEEQILSRGSEREPETTGFQKPGADLKLSGSDFLIVILDVIQVSHMLGDAFSPYLIGTLADFFKPLIHLYQPPRVMHDQVPQASCRRGGGRGGFQTKDS